MSSSENAFTQEWLPTSEAARALGISDCTLKRYARRDGLLQEGTHFRRGPHANTTLLWHMPSIFPIVRPGVVR